MSGCASAFLVVLEWSDSVVQMLDDSKRNILLKEKTSKICLCPPSSSKARILSTFSLFPPSFMKKLVLCTFFTSHFFVLWLHFSPPIHSPPEAMIVPQLELNRPRSPTISFLLHPGNFSLHIWPNLQQYLTYEHPLSALLSWIHWCSLFWYFTFYLSMLLSVPSVISPSYAHIICMHSSTFPITLLLKFLFCLSDLHFCGFSSNPHGGWGTDCSPEL